MHAVEFRAKIADGKIDIPNEYLHGLSSDVKIIIICENPIAEKVAPCKSIKGIVNRYANPELMFLEKDAWGEAVKEKHVAN